jgi:hypothetical protein
MYLLTERFIFWEYIDRSVLKEGFKTYLIASMSPLNTPTFFCLDICSLWTIPPIRNQNLRYEKFVLFSLFIYGLKAERRLNCGNMNSMFPAGCLSRHHAGSNDRSIQLHRTVDISQAFVNFPLFLVISYRTLFFLSRCQLKEAKKWIAVVKSRGFLFFSVRIFSRLNEAILCLCDDWRLLVVGKKPVFSSVRKKLSGDRAMNVVNRSQPRGERASRNWGRSREETPWVHNRMLYASCRPGIFLIFIIIASIKVLKQQIDEVETLLTAFRESLLWKEKTASFWLINIFRESSNLHWPRLLREKKEDRQKGVSTYPWRLVSFQLANNLLVSICSSFEG